jgi:transposase-like protein
MSINLCDLQAPAFTDDDAAREAMEAIMWPDGPVCPHCGSLEKLGKVEGPSARAGLYYCGACKSQFTVTVGTIFERSKVPLSKWWTAVHLLASSKKGISSHQLHRMLGVHYQTAWFMTHRIREAMAGGSFREPMGGKGKIVEVDETFIGKREGVEKRRGGAHKNVVLSLVERGGSARSFHVDSTKKEDIIPIVKANIARETHVMTDESNTYSGLGKRFAKHSVVDHSRKEYAYTDRLSGISVGINSAEGFYSVFKRGMKGVYQYCKEKHLHRYVAEFDFRHSNRTKLGVTDAERAAKIIKGAKGKRLVYRRPEEVTVP